MRANGTVTGRWRVCLDAGKCFIDKSRAWSAWSQVLGVPQFSLAAIVGAAIVRGEPLVKVLPAMINRDDRAGIRDTVESLRWLARGGSLSRRLTHVSATPAGRSALQNPIPHSSPSRWIL